MTLPVIISDNSQKERSALSEQQWADLSRIAGRKVKELCARDEEGVSLLVFPDRLNIHGDKIGDNTIIDIRNDTLFTGNLMGFVGCGTTRLRIRSRFDEDDRDYFLHYMLEKVFSINLLDLQYSTDPEAIFDFILFLFPYFLNRALSQGLYKEYITCQHNDSRVRGVIDVSRHVRMNIPFTGNVAYRTREHTADNNLTELIRHTIEYIKTKPFGQGILSHDEETKGNVALITEATTRYEKRDRLNVVSKNLRAKVHPYYTEYEPLRKLCIQILQQEELKYGREDDTIYGVLFDGAWLWERYLNTILSDVGFQHPDNISGSGARYLFKERKGPRYPDFYNPAERIVLDAKYKRYEGKALTDISTEDLAQVVSYMYIMQFPTGGFLVPGGREVHKEDEKLHGYPGTMYLFNIPIPDSAKSYGEFSKMMAEGEEAFIEKLESIKTVEQL